MYAQVNTTRTVFNVREFVAWLQNEQLKLRPTFQRKSVWNSQEKSYLIDTVFRGMPLPIVILRDTSGTSVIPKREVVDGQQRLTTLIGFVAPNLVEERDRFVLSKSHHGEHAGMSFEELPDDLKLRILEYEVSTHVLHHSTSDDDVLRIFQRLNSTGSKLSGQELRNALYNGAFKQYVGELSLSFLHVWRSGRLFSDAQLARMQEIELTAQLIVQIMDGTQGTSKKKIDDLYDRYNEEFDVDESIRSLFVTTMNAIWNDAGDLLPYSQFQKTTWFFTLFAFVCEKLKLGDQSILDPGNIRKTVEAFDTQWADMSPEQQRQFNSRTTNKAVR